MSKKFLSRILSLALVFAGSQFKNDQAKPGRKGGAESSRWGKVGYFPDQEHPGK